MGGITKTLEIMEIALSYQKNVELQSWSYPLGQAANLHIMLSHQNCDFFEQVVPFEDHEHGALNFIRTDNQGLVSVPSKPGLGIDINWHQIEKDVYKQYKY